MAVVRLHQNSETQTVTLSDEADPHIAIELDVAQIDSLLQALGDMRARMEPRVDVQWQPGRAVQAINNPRFAAELPPQREFALLHIRDPRFGWLHYTLPFGEGGRLAEFLAKAAQKAAAAPQAPSD